MGRNAYPMWVGDTMYFNTDRSPDGITNLWAQDLGTGAAKQVTSYTDFDVMSPSTDGKRIVYVQSGYLYVLDTATGSSRKVQVSIPSEDWRLQDRWINPSEYLHFVDVAGNGKAVVAEARGDVFHLALADKETLPRNLTRTPGVREDTPRLSPDGRGSPTSRTRRASTSYVRDVWTGETSQVTTDLDRKVYHPRWSPDGKKILFGDKDYALHVVDLLTKKRTKIDESHYLDNDEFTWEVTARTTPGRRFPTAVVAYSCPARPQQRDLPVRHARGPQGPAHRRLLREPQPTLRHGRRLPLLPLLPELPDRDEPLRGRPHRDEPVRVMVAQLRKGEKPPFVKRPATEVVPAAVDEKATEKKDDPLRFRVDVEGLVSRVYALPVDPGNDFHLMAGNGYAVWSSVPLFTEDEYEEIYRPGGETKWTLHLFSMKDQKEVTLEEKIAEAQVSVNGDELVLRKDKGVYVTSVAKAYESRKAGTEVDLSGMTYLVAPREEWRQIFADTWRWYRDFFYDKDMHGRDWKATRAKYAPWVEEIRTRQQLNWLLSEMVGELCVSHTYIGGGDMGRRPHPGRPPWRRGCSAPTSLRTRRRASTASPASTGRPRTSPRSRRPWRGPTWTSRRATTC